MKDYFKRLKTHPGLGIAAFITICCYIAALSNHNLSTNIALIIGTVGSSFIWSIVLISNFGRK